jgi:hypothetical protein
LEATDLCLNIIIIKASLRISGRAINHHATLSSQKLKPKHLFICFGACKTKFKVQPKSPSMLICIIHKVLGFTVKGIFISIDNMQIMERLEMVIRTPSDRK